MKTLRSLRSPWHWLTRTCKAHWLFRLPDTLLVRLQMQDGQRRDLDALTTSMTTSMIALAQNQGTLASLVADVRSRVAHHEAGPLKRSLASYESARADGIRADDILSVSPRANGRKQTSPQQPGKHIDASGMVVDAPSLPPLPAEAVGDDGDE